MSKTSYALIGDVHSQSAPLNAALSFCKQNNLIPILLGDLFDSRCDTSDSVGVYQAVRKIESEIPGTVILQSNHQNKLIRYLKGNKVKVFKDLQTTLDDFNKEGIDLVGEVLPWLDLMPYGFVFKDSAGTEYRCAHACFPAKLQIPSYAASHKVLGDGLIRKDIDTMVYGPFYKVTLEDGKVTSDRLPWWLENVNRGWIRVAGHYHNVHLGDRSIVLDGQMGGSSLKEVGTADMKLCLYDVEAKALHSFDIAGNHSTSTLQNSGGA